MSTLSTDVPPKMLGSQKLRKRTLDDKEFVASYMACALVEGVTGEFRARSFSRILCVLPRFYARLEAGGSVGIVGAWVAKGRIVELEKIIC